MSRGGEPARDSAREYPHYLSKDMPVQIVSDRINVSRKVLDKHYDKRSEEVKLEQRRSFLGNV